MNDSNFYSAANDVQNFPNGRGRPSPGGNPILIVLGILGILSFLLCGGIVAFGFFAAHSVSHPKVAIEAPDIDSGFSADERLFNIALQQKLREVRLLGDPIQELETSQPLSPENESLISWLKAMAESEQPVLLDNEYFQSAVLKRGRGKIGVLSAISLRNTIQDGAELEAERDEHGTLLSVASSEDRKYATANWLFYDSSGNVLSVQWFIAKKQSQWVVYDWQRLEYGRRYSDEFANYFANSMNTNADGYDIAMELVGEALQTDGQKEALRKIRRAESIRMLDEDQNVAKLRIAWTYMHYSKYDDAKRLLKSIENPKRFWGAWQTLAMIHQIEGNESEAISLAQRSLEISPDHPTINMVLCDELLKRNKGDDATNGYRRMLDSWLLCPEYTALLYRLSASTTQANALSLLVASARSAPSLAGFDRVAEELLARDLLESDSVDQLRKLRSIDVDRIRYLELRIQAENGGQEDFDQLASSFRDLVANSKDEDFRQSISDWYVNHCESTSRFDLIFVDPDLTNNYLKNVALQFAYEEVYLNQQKLQQALDNAPEYVQKNHLSHLIRGGLVSDTNAPLAIESLRNISTRWQR